MGVKKAPDFSEAFSFSGRIIVAVLAQAPVLRNAGIDFLEVHTATRTVSRCRLIS